MQDLERRQRRLEEELRRKDAEIRQMKISPAKPSGDTAVPNPSPAGGGKAIPADPLPAADVGGEGDPEEGIPPLPASNAIATSASGAQAPAPKWGTYTPNFGFKVVDTNKGDMSVSILDSTYCRSKTRSSGGIPKLCTLTGRQPEARPTRFRSAPRDSPSTPTLSWPCDP
jgi:hypothetical protein